MHHGCELSGQGHYSGLLHVPVLPLHPCLAVVPGFPSLARSSLSPTFGYADVSLPHCPQADATPQKPRIFPVHRVDRIPILIRGHFLTFPIRRRPHRLYTRSHQYRNLDRVPVCTLDGDTVDYPGPSMLPGICVPCPSPWLIAFHRGYRSLSSGRGPQGDEKCCYLFIAKLSACRLR